MTQITWVPRFLRYVTIGPNCWEWSGCTKRGYGWFRADGKSANAHRFALEISGTKVPKGMCACHSCDNPKCVRPSHLFIGTHADNSLDMWNKGRGRPPAVRDACRRGHKKSVQNTYWRWNRSRSRYEAQCRVCGRISKTPNPTRQRKPRTAQELKDDE